MTDQEKISIMFTPNKKCIVNTDLDGILSGIILQNFLNWEIVGFSSCSGKTSDELWLKDKNIKIHECVFVDLPVAIKNIPIIDQHFVALDDDSIMRFNKCDNKLNPNIMRKRVFSNVKNNCEYSMKYPFGTVHFIITCLENLNIIPKNFNPDLYKDLNGFDLADLILRADCVIGNTFKYNKNCIDWSNWLIEYGGSLIKNLFTIVQNEYSNRHKIEPMVEAKLKSLGCGRADGDCSNLFRKKDYTSLKTYFDFLANSIGLKTLPIYDVFDFNKLSGCRLTANYKNIEELKHLLIKNNTFSYAFVMMNLLSVTYLKKGEE